MALHLVHEAALCVNSVCKKQLYACRPNRRAARVGPSPWHWPSKSMASLRVIWSSSGNRIEPEGPTSLAEESKNSIMGPQFGEKGAEKSNKIWRYYRPIECPK